MNTLLLLLLATGPVQGDGVKDEITRLSRSYDAAIKARDAEALGRLFDDEGRFVLLDGRLLDKRGLARIFHSRFEK